MASLQELYDFYLETNPSTGKIRNATNFLIHACQAMDVSSPEEIVDERLIDLPPAIDRYFNDNHQKAVHDKGVLAEMIGRYGPKNGWEKVFRLFLKDKDENLRQFVLQSLEFCAHRDPQLVMPYIEEFKNGKNKLMRRVSSILVLRMLCSQQKEFITRQIQEWAKSDPDFVQLIMELLEHQTQNSLNNPEKRIICKETLKWLNNHVRL